MNFKELHHLIQSGVHPVITCQKKVEELENYAEPSMRARIIGSALRHADVVTLNLDFTEFDEYNKAFESSNYYDRAGQAVLTAREAGQYSLKQEYYVMASDEMEPYMVVTEANALALLKAYQDSGEKTPYSEWLERRVKNLEDRLGSAKFIIETLRAESSQVRT